MILARCVACHLLQFLYWLFCKLAKIVERASDKLIEGLYFLADWADRKAADFL